MAKCKALTGSAVKGLTERCERLTAAFARLSLRLFDRTKVSATEDVADELRKTINEIVPCHDNLICNQVIVYV